MAHHTLNFHLGQSAVPTTHSQNFQIMGYVPQNPAILLCIQQSPAFVEPVPEPVDSDPELNGLGGKPPSSPAEQNLKCLMVLTVQ